MPDSINPSLSAARSAFTEQLVGLGFEEDGATESGAMFVGEVEYAAPDGSVREEIVQVVVPPDFPYQPPAVFTTTGAEGLSWHRWSNQALCLWAEDASVAHLPWRNAVVLVERIETWLTSAAGQWQDDLPVLDLERYFPRDGSLFEFDSTSFNFRRDGVFECTTRRVGQTDVYSMDRYVSRMPMQRNRQGLYGFTIDVGELGRPPASWDELASGIPQTQRIHVRDVVRYHRRAIVIVRYQRYGVEGETVFLLTRVDGTIQIQTAMTPVPSGHSIRTLRGGKNFEELGSKRVAVVGVGAVGSFAVDLLLRSGVGRVSLYDPEVLRPGNAIRHLCASNSEELRPKVEAVKERVLQYGFVDPDTISVVTTAVTSIADARVILDGHDVVIDATASGAPSTMLADLATVDTPVVGVALQRSGEIIRIDIYPGDESQRLPPVEPLPNENPLLLEAGCGDPISPTPPAAVLEAAVWVHRVVEALLVGGPLLDRPSLAIVLAPQEDEPFTHVGVVQ